MSEVILVQHLIVPIRTIPIILRTGHLLQILIRIQDIRPTCHEIMLYVSIIRDSSLTCLTLFSGHQDNTIGTARTIDGSGRTIFQYRDRLDICLCDVTKVATGHTVNYD